MRSGRGGVADGAGHCIDGHGHRRWCRHCEPGDTAAVEGHGSVGHAAPDAAHDTAGLGSDNEGVAGVDGDGLGFLTDTQDDRKYGAIAGLKGEPSRDLLKSLGSYLDFVCARRKCSQVELTYAITYSGEDFFVGDLTQLDGGSGNDGSRLIFYGTGDLGMAVEGAAIVLRLKVDGARVWAGIRGDGSGRELHINGEVVAGIELLIGARALNEVIAGFAAIPRSGLRLSSVPQASRGFEPLEM